MHSSRIVRKILENWNTLDRILQAIDLPYPFKIVMKVCKLPDIRIVVPSPL